MTSDNQMKVDNFLKLFELHVTSDNLLMDSDVCKSVVPLLSLPFTYKGLKSKVIHYSCMDDQIVLIHNSSKNGSSAVYLNFKEFFQTVFFD